jgi:aerobic-type carbon monoxide dehydrogenase small subunit (CoxS/CutS family)
MQKTLINFNLNGQKIAIEIEPQLTLLEMLRDRLGVKSPKCGCDRGDCGTCTVILDGQTVRSCLILAVEVTDRKVTTLEGVMKDGKLTPIQKAFIDNNSFQCGFCAPGMILSATELLGKNLSPSREEIQEALSGNLCRCTGYSPIIDTILEFTKGGKNGG